jgi:hypothetical protein
MEISPRLTGQPTRKDAETRPCSSVNRYSRPGARVTVNAVIGWGLIMVVMIGVAGWRGR